MKQIFLASMLILSVFALNGAELFYSNGTSVSIQKAEEMHAVKSDASKAAGHTDALYSMNTGRYVYHFVRGTEKKGGNELPIYFLGDMPAVAERTVFWRGEKSVEYMEKKYGMKLVEIFPTYPIYSFEVPGDSVEIAEEIVKNGDGYAFPDFVHEADQYALDQNFVPGSAPNDPYFERQWHLSNTGTAAFHFTSSEYSGSVVENADTKFLQMLQFLNSNHFEVDPNTTIAIMDSGVADHDDLNIIRPGYDAVRDDDTSASAGSPNLSLLNGSNVSTIAHGTECAGVSAGVGNNIGISGMCPWCKIYPVRYYLNGAFSNEEATAFTYGKMLKIYEKYVADPNIVAVNCSFGPDAANGASLVSPAVVEGIRNFMLNGRDGKGGAIVYASGNDNADSSYNRIFEYDFKFERNGVEVTNRVITVNATTAWDTKAEYSNYGHASTVSAPSRSQGPIVGIATTTIPSVGDFPNDSDYTHLFGGTSAAAPVVSGLLGVIFSVNPDLTLEQAVEILKQSSDKINPATGLWKNGFSVKYGYGRVNLEKAVRLAKGLSMCVSATDNDVCGNHLDDNCDGYVDEDCTEEIPLPPAGRKCNNDSDCASSPWTTSDVACLTSREAWNFAEGYCFVRSRINTPSYSFAPCPDGTRILGGLENDGNLYFYYCALECNKDHQCPSNEYYCSDEVLGVCLPLCHDNSGCTAGHTCNAEGHCVPQCGNGELDDGEECDNGEDNGRTDCAYGETSCKVCTTDCREKNGVTSYCGDRSLDPHYGEKCDNGSYNGIMNCNYGETSCTVCTSECKEAAGNTAYCGDGVTNSGYETCDNGSDNGRTDCLYGQTSCTVCTTGCQTAQGATSYCGDSRIDGTNGETCDNGSDNGRTNCAYGQMSCTVCTTGCQPANGITSYCGDKHIDGTNGETCDNGSDNGRTDCEYGQTGCTVCTTGCRTAQGATSYCGDNRVDGTNGETCDHGTNNGRTDCDYGQTGCTVCTTGCQPADGTTSYCGDKRVDGTNGEECDDGTDNGRENCEYGQTGCTVCTAGCRTAQGATSYCGDGVTDTANGETCDDGNTEDGDYCSSDCTTVTGYCGDGTKQNNEACDDGSDNGKTDCVYGETSCIVCTNACSEAAGNTSYCGDGNTDTANGEACDNGFDNGRTACDYGERSCFVCTTDCRTEVGTTSYCGDGYTDPENGEICDDGESNGEIEHCNDTCNGIVETPETPDEETNDSDETADEEEKSDNDETTDGGNENPDSGENSDHEEVPDSNEDPDEAGSSDESGHSSDDEGPAEVDDNGKEQTSDSDTSAEETKKSGGCSVLMI